MCVCVCVCVCEREREILGDVAILRVRKDVAFLKAKAHVYSEGT